jgi:hypothetical protein
MSANQKNSNEGTDLNEVIHKAKKQLLEGQEAGTAEKKTIKVSDKQKAAAILGTVLLGGSAFVAVDRINGQVVEPQVAPADSTQVSTESGIPGVTSPASTEPIAVGVTQPVAGGTICPTEDIQIASGVTDSMSFSEAFASAREEVGPGGVFTWHGTTYNTFFKDEWNQIGLADKQEFLHNIGYNVEVPEERDVTDNHREEVPEKVDGGEVDPVDNNPPAIDWASADVKETMIDGKLAYVLDSDKDGIVDAIVIPNEESNQTVVLLDESGDGSLDTMVVMDSNMQPIASEPMDEPIELTMAEIDLYNESDGNDVILQDETEAQAFEQEVEEELEEDGDVDSDESISMSGDYTNDDDVEDIS